MDNNSKMKQFFTKLGEKLNDQVWYQQLKSKWEELDPQSRTYVQLAVIGGTTLLILSVVISAVMGVRGLREEVREKAELVSMIQSANEEIRRLRESVSGMAAGGGEDMPWPTYLENTAGSAGIAKENLKIDAEKPMKPTEFAKESVITIGVKNINVKQLVRYAFTLENGARPVKVRSMNVDTKPDMTGYLDATFTVSAYSTKTE